MSIRTTSSASPMTASGTVSRTRMIVQALEVLDVDRGEHVDPGREDILDVLVALEVLDARRVRVCELVDQRELRPAAEDSRKVHLLEHRLPVGHAPARDGLEPLSLGEGVHAPVRLYVADDDVTSVLGLRLALAQHLVGLADAGGHPEEDLVVPVTGGFHGSYLGARALCRSEDCHAPSRLCTIRSISLIPMKGAINPPRP
jgi:hypothetical protein